MSHFDPLTKEEKILRDSIVTSRLKEELEFFNVPDGAVGKIENSMAQILPFLKSENKIEVAIASDCYARLS
jgi:hypothetical protein